MLTEKQENFVQGLIAGKSQREAYKAAYNAANMKDETIDSKASALFAQDKVRARYEALQAMVRDEGERRAVATAVEVLEELTAVGLGTKEFPAYDMFGNEQPRKPNITARLKALELLAKHHGLLTDKVEVSNPEPLKIVVDYGGE